MDSLDMDLRKLAGMIKDIKFTMLTTVNEDGSMSSRPMATQKIDDETFDGRLWFFTKKDTHKVHSIKHDQHVNLAYAHPEKQSYISVAGRARVVENKEKMRELWNPLLKAWFPEGLEDPQISLISVNIDSAEIWDAPPSKIVQMVGMMKSIVTGKPYDHEAHSQHLNLNH